MTLMQFDDKFTELVFYASRYGFLGVEAETLLRIMLGPHAERSYRQFTKMCWPNALRTPNSRLLSHSAYMHFGYGREGQKVRDFIFALTLTQWSEHVKENNLYLNF